VCCGVGDVIGYPSPTSSFTKKIIVEYIATTVEIMDAVNGITHL
jgi:hypothetical protein